MIDLLNVQWNRGGKELLCLRNDVNSIKSTLNENKKNGFACFKIAGKVVNIRTDKDGKYIVKRDYSTEGFSKRFFSVLGSSPFSKQLSQRLNSDYSQKSEPVNFGGTPNVVSKIFNNALFGDEEDRRSTSSDLSANADPISLDGFAGQLNGRLYKTGNLEDKKTVIFIHGGTQNISADKQSSSLAETYNNNGYDVLAVNMRGYGKSDGLPSEKGMYSDAQVMFDYVHQTLGIPVGDILIHGYSLGGPVAANLYKHLESSGLKTAGLILDRPMPS
ncbi:alpha/beta hydrolase [Iodobacter fluviatilis]|uniref:Alpha/beta hydrolase family n=1 Tax=Iodobacter fluviatilis TaxID=537 RepID=A0A377Q5I9_9NEIS|nr:alpha/beta fold hydrolase [Iodobacter fluviatilis]TCU80268.1 alpha/beta hydrolase family protein [Iodobacter fluviatilis]STQ90193.1 Alpha/beta hydrolase family [Iodobacter fluviatilis]